MGELKNIFQNNKKEILFTFFSFLIFFLLVFVVFFYNQTPNQNNNNNDQRENLSYFENVRNFFGNNNQNNNSNPGEDSDDKQQNNINLTDNKEGYVEDLIQVWDRPVAGHTVSSENILTFVDSETGLVYEKNLLEPKTKPKQITATSSLFTISNIYKAYFLKDKQGVRVKKILLQYPDQNNIIKSILATLPIYSDGPSKLQNTQTLSDNITKVAVSNDETKLVFLVSKETRVAGVGDVSGHVYLIDNNDFIPTQIYNNPLTIWNLFITNTGYVYISEIDTAFETNNLYKININNKENYLENNLEKIYGDHTGLSFLFDQNNLLISASTGVGIKTYLNNAFLNKNFKDKDLIELPLKTLAKKCAFEKNLLICAVPQDIKNYNKFLPDAWYQGVENFKDNLYYIDLTEDIKINFLYNLENKDKVDFDIISTKITKNTSHLIMINKNNRNLWSLNIKNIISKKGDTE